MPLKTSLLTNHQVDINLAKAVAETGPPEDDEQLRRKLWLDIARRVVQQGDGQGAVHTLERHVRIASDLRLLSTNEGRHNQYPP